jgi:hypothetical protein
MPAAEDVSSEESGTSDSPQPATGQADAAEGSASAPGLDVALVDVRLVSAGSRATGEGPVYRIYLRNAGSLAFDRPIQLAVLASTADGSGTTPPVTVELAKLAVGATAAVDVQLDASLAGAASTARRLYVVVDSQQQFEETDETNNLADLALEQIAPVPLRALRLSPEDVAPGSELRIEGSGFGEVAGQVVLEVAGVKMLAEVVSWSDSLVCVRLPSLVLDGPTTAKLTVMPPNDEPREGLALRLASR